MVALEVSAVVACDARQLWEAWLPTFPIRPRQEESQNADLYRLAYGLRIPMTLVVLNRMQNWTVEHRLPAGSLTIDHRIAPTDDGRVEISKRLEVRGPMVVPYRTAIFPAVRREWPGQVRELVRQAGG